MVTTHSPGCLPRASSAMRSWMSLVERTLPSAGKTLRSASRSMWAWPSFRPGMTVRFLRSSTRVVGAVCAGHRRVLAGGEDLVAGDSNRLGDRGARIDGDDVGVLQD